MGCTSSKKTARPDVDVYPMVGSRYLVTKPARLMESPVPDSEISATIQPQAKVLVLDTETSAGFCHALAESLGKAGWLAKPIPVSLRRLKGSRDVPGRYRVLVPAALHSAPSMRSEEEVQAEKNDEVELLELGVSDGRVVGRVKICGKAGLGSATGCVAFDEPSPLDAANLLGPEVADQPPLSATDTPPWQVGEKYRILKTQPLQKQPASQSRCCKSFSTGPTALRGSLVEVLRLQETNGFWMQVSVYDGPNPGKSGWIRSQLKDSLLVDRREQYKVQLGEDVAPATPGKRVVKSLDTLAAFEVPDPAEPVDDVDTQEDFAESKRLSCGYCVCQVVPPERNHPATVHHHSAFELPASPSKRLEVLSPMELQQWLRGIYLRYNPSLLPKVPEFVESHKGKESSLVESVCRKYRVSPPREWYKTQ
ncbi:unnamed protein product [Durusdinium trenchii]|uniref:Uncharacterized protein n=1 Tax=Durusdinium trenchii TaxID=1381693 RepID=A0ABP0L486_9DINO